MDKEQFWEKFSTLLRVLPVSMICHVYENSDALQDCIEATGAGSFGLDADDIKESLMFELSDRYPVITENWMNGDEYGEEPSMWFSEIIEKEEFLSVGEKKREKAGIRAKTSNQA